MVTPRVVRLFRVSTLREFQRCIQEVVVGLDPRSKKAAAVIVPTRSASEQVRSMLAKRDVAECVPAIVSRASWYEWLRLRLPSQPNVLTPIQPQVLAAPAARAAARGLGRAANGEAEAAALRAGFGGVEARESEHEAAAAGVEMFS